MPIIFDPDIYRDNNQDLARLGLSNEELETHFKEFGRNEARIFAQTSNQVERFSMAFLRGKGLEVGPGSNLFPVFENTSLDYADIDGCSHYQTDLPLAYNNFQIDSKNLFISYPEVKNSYDFVVASHVLEHVNSLGRALLNLSNLVSKDGKVYIILPVIERDWDKFWMPYYGIFHHILEFYFPQMFLFVHRLRFRAAVESIGSKFKSGLDSDTQFSFDTNSLQGRDYIYHKHSYSIYGWVSMLNLLIKFFKIPLLMVDVASCSVRNDIHIMFSRNHS